MPRSRALGLLVLALTAWERTSAAAPGVRTAPSRGSLVAAPAHGSISVDGRALEPVWQSAPIGVALAQREPTYGAAAPLYTSFQVAFDREALFVLVRAQVGPEGAVVRSLKRDDTSISEDDSITIKIDPNVDRRTSFNFTINTAGAQHDTLMLDNGVVDLAQWDAVWEGQVTRDERGYVAEYRIPFSVLGVQERAVQSMGFNLSRVSVRPSATVDWVLPDPPQSINSASTYGTITGIAGIRSGHALELTPYVALKTDFKSPFSMNPRRSPTLGAGFDARIQTAPGSYADLSVLTDFSQEAIDSVQVAGDRFPLFFDEQRAFFINGLGAFRFGQYKLRQLVDTRRIGLSEHGSVPVATGLKVYGETGAVTYALLNVQTLGKDAPSGAPTNAAVPAENFSVARLRMDTTKNLSLGGIAALRHRFQDATNDHFSMGVDAELKSNDGKLSWYTFWAGAATEHPSRAPVVDVTNSVVEPGQAAYVNRGESAYTRIRYAGQVIRPYLDYAYSTRHFDPALGYYSRTGVAEHYATVELAPRINRYGLQEIVIAPGVAFTADPTYARLLKQSYAVEAKALFLKGQLLSYRFEQRGDTVESPFPLFGYEVAAGKYNVASHVATLTTPVRQSVDAFYRYTYSNAFSGYRHELAQTLRVRASQHFTTTLGYEYWMGRLDDTKERFAFGFGNGSAALALSPDLVLDSLGRFNLQPGREQFGMQARLRYRYKPGSDLFVVYRTSQPLAGSRIAASNELSLKLNYYAQLGF
jgi:Carbohydrate family 9 binding domain-like